MAKSLYDPITWMVGGEAGYGIMTMGQMFARAAARAGLHIHGYSEYPSLIRGGHNTAMVRVASEKVHSHTDKMDVLIALNKETVDLHLDEMNEGGVILYDGQQFALDAAELGGKVAADVKFASVPFADITKELGADKIMRNMVAFSASAAICGLPFEYVESVMKTNFARKGPEVVEMNIKVAKAGYDKAAELGIEFGKKLELSDADAAGGGDAARQIVISGNDSIALGAIKAGLKFMAAYPMTPVTSIMLNIAKNAERYGIIMKQTEDEIAAVNMAIGAAHMGVRSMTASSGGGFALMSEALGMAAMTETPLVIVEGTRPGPSTGLPTWTDQGDLRFVLHASQGEFPLVTALPGDAQECFDMTLKVFNLAEKYQMPCLIITDKYLGEGIYTVPPFEADDYVPESSTISMEAAENFEAGEYLRFKLTESGVSPRALPGHPNCIYTASTDEHAEDGDLDESSENRVAMVDKRDRKFETLKREALSEDELFEVHGGSVAGGGVDGTDGDADLTIVGWGSTKGPILEAVEVANAQGLKVDFLQIKYASPFPAEGVERVLREALESGGKLLLVENNSTAQMGGMVREYTGVKIEKQLLKYDGRPVHPSEVLAKIQELLNS
jgi:2-oxoglutarate/2-oxoacid ferredoxin oxidoreductase subunit alpha